LKIYQGITFRKNGIYLKLFWTEKDMAKRDFMMREMERPAKLATLLAFYTVASGKLLI
jgi:hypothetical protein